MIYVALLILLAFSSCTDELRTTTVEGVAVDIKTGKPVPYAHINVTSSGGGNGELLGGSSGSTVGSWDTDADGKFSFSFIHNNKLSYEVGGNKHQLYHSSNILAIKRKKNKDVKIELYPFSWLKVHLKDVAPAKNATKISFSGLFNLPTSSIDWPPADTTFTVKIISKKDEETFSYWLYNYREVTRYELSAKLNSLDTTDVFINY